MRRRDFIAGLGSAAAWPLAAGAQQGERVRRVGVLFEFDENDPMAKAQFSAFTQGLAGLGWTDGRNLRIDIRWTGVDFGRMQMFANELIDLRPDVIVTAGFPATRLLQQQTRTIPIIFIAGGDPVTGGLVGSISRPDGNTTGFPALFASIGGKWLELLKQAVPRVARVALVFNPELVFNSKLGRESTYFDSIEAAAAQYGVTAIRSPVRNAVEIGRAVETFAAEPNGGLIIVPPPLLGAENELIRQLAVQHRLPTIWANRRGAEDGGLLSYGGNIPDLFRRGVHPMSTAFYAAPK